MPVSSRCCSACDDAPLDLAHVVHVLGQLRLRSRAPEPRCRSRALSRDGVEDAGVLLQPRAPLLRRGAVAAEHPLEHDARVDLHRQRLRRRAPADRAHVRAEEIAGAAAEVARVILGRKLHRRERRALPDLLRDDLIDRRPELEHAALGRERAAQPHRGARRVAVLAVVGQVGQHGDVLPERLERLEDRRELEVGALLRRRPLAHDRAVRHVDEAEARRRSRRRSAPAPSRPAPCCRAAAARCVDAKASKERCGGGWPSS